MFQCAAFENEKAGYHPGPIAESIKFVVVSLPAEDHAALVSQCHFNDIALVVVLILFLANKRTRGRIRNIFGPVSPGTISRDFQQLAWPFYQPFSLKFQ